MSQTISVIGCGWLGLPCAIRFVAEGYHVKGTTTTATKISTLEKHGIEPYLLQLDTDEPSTQLFNCDILFVNFPPGRHAENIVTRYQDRIAKVIHIAEKTSLKKIIFASSTGVYAGHTDVPVVTEYTPPQPRRNSAKAMYEAEVTLAAYTDQLTILRFAGLVGPDRKAAKFLAGKQNLPNPNNSVNLVHLDDCVEAVQRIVTKNIFGAVYNVCADLHPSRQEYYTRLTTDADLAPPTFSTQQISPDKIVSNEKIKRELDFTFKYPDPFQF